MQLTLTKDADLLRVSFMEQFRAMRQRRCRAFTSRLRTQMVVRGKMQRRTRLSAAVRKAANAWHVVTRAALPATAEPRS